MIATFATKANCWGKELGKEGSELVGKPIQTKALGL